MAKTFRLEVITPERLFYKGEVEMVVVKAIDGYEGYLADHQWQVKLLDTGKLKIKEPGKPVRVAAVTGGYVDVSDYIMIYVDAAEWPEEIDVERALRSKTEAENILSEKAKDSIIAVNSAKHDIIKALNRINVKNEMRF